MLTIHKTLKFNRIFVPTIRASSLHTVSPESSRRQQKMTEAHGHVKHDEYNQIRYNKLKQSAIIGRENKIFKKWNEFTIL